ncbi:MAG: sensor histidine kinase, partial [Spirochaetota bacterium]
SLYMGRGFSSLSIKSFLNDLLFSIQQTYSGDVPVSINSRIEDIDIAAKQSFSLGIIINELVTNSYKYAFPGADNGAIDVVVEMTDDKTLHIIVSDTGQGMAADVVEKKNYGFGLTLVDLFVRQYKGTIDISVEEGTRVDIVLPMLPVEKKG